jgi:hypothetical protein
VRAVAGLAGSGDATSYDERHNGPRVMRCPQQQHKTLCGTVRAIAAIIWKLKLKQSNASYPAEARGARVGDDHPAWYALIYATDYRYAGGEQGVFPGAFEPQVPS